MNNKEYGVKLGIDISNFTKGINTAKKITEAMGEELKKKAQEPMQEATSSMKKGFLERIEGVSSLSEEYANLIIKYADAVLIEGKKSKSAEELKNQIKDLTQQMKNEEKELEVVGEAMSELGEEEDNTKKNGFDIKRLFTEFGRDVSKSINRGIRGLKRFALSLFGIQSIYSMLSKSVHAYMSLDNSMHDRMQASWIALGATLAPIIEKLIQLLQKFVGYVNVAYKVFTGKNLIEIAMKKVDKSTKNASKSLKGLNKELADFDEITNLNFDKGNDDDIGANGVLDALKEINDMQLNPKIVKFIEDMSLKLKELWEKLKNNKELLKDIMQFGAVAFVGWKVGELVTSIAKILGVAGGTAGLYGIIGALAIIDVYLGVKLIDKVAKLEDAWRKQHEEENKLYETEKEGLDIILRKLNEENLSESDRVTLIGDASDIYEQYLRNLDRGVLYSKDQKGYIEGQVEAIEKVSGKSFKTTIQADVKMTRESMNWWDRFINSIRNISQFSPASLGQSAGQSLRNILGFAKGNVAYGPTLAEFGEYSGARSNPEITAPQNIIRDTLFEALSEALPQTKAQQGDIVLNINGREFARATYSDYQSEANRIGSSSVAIRRV